MWILPRIIQNRLDSQIVYLPDKLKFNFNLSLNFKKKIQLLKVMSKLYMVAHAYNPRSGEV